MSSRVSMGITPKCRRTDLLEVTMNVPDWIMTHGDNLQFVLFFTLLFLLMAAERLVPRRPEPMERPLRWPVNFLLTLVNLATLSLIPISFIGVAEWAEARHIGLFNAIHLPLVVAVPATLLIRAFVSFGTHYLHHAVP